jgi:hypothetical protein
MKKLTSAADNGHDGTRLLLAKHVSSKFSALIILSQDESA